jgi:hypothetical protein
MTGAAEGEKASSRHEIHKVNITFISEDNPQKQLQLASCRYYHYTSGNEQKIAH